MNKVLIIYPISHHKTLVDSISENLYKEGILIDSFDITKWQLYSSSYQLNRSWYKKLVTFECSLPKLGWIFSKLNTLIHLTFDKRILKSLLNEYDIIDFHYYERIYMPLIKQSKSLGKGIKIHHWGSDLLRATNVQKHMLTEAYKYCDIIQVATPSMKDVILSFAPEFSDKIRILHFGNSVFSKYNKLLSEELDVSFINGYKKGKIVITCGYNGAKGQQHIKLINAISKLPLNLQERLFVLFPMTYGATESYIKEVDEYLQTQDFSYCILRDRLSVKELFDLRRITDIAFNAQLTDAFSGSIQEHVFCGNILLVGNWLNYDVMRQAGVFYISYSKHDIVSSLKNVVENINEYKNQCSQNQKRIYELCSWEHVAPQMSRIYESLNI